MKKQSSLLLILMLLLVLAGCGAKSAPTEPPELTVTNAQGVSITAMGGSYDWDYDLGNGQRSGAIACGVCPIGAAWGFGSVSELLRANAAFVLDEPSQMPAFFETFSA